MLLFSSNIQYKNIYFTRQTRDNKLVNIWMNNNKFNLFNVNIWMRKLDYVKRKLEKFFFILLKTVFLWTFRFWLILLCFIRISKQITKKVFGTESQTCKFKSSLNWKFNKFIDFHIGISPQNTLRLRELDFVTICWFCLLEKS